MRWFQCGFATWSAEQSIPYIAFNTTRWHLLARQLPVGAGGMQSINMRKHHIELYKTCKRTIVSSIKSARDTFTIPFLSFYLDLIKSKTSNQKFVALRVCFNTLENVNLGYNLVCSSIRADNAGAPRMPIVRHIDRLGGWHSERVRH
jgi:hypothetical protein